MFKYKYNLNSFKAYSKKKITDNNNYFFKKFYFKFVLMLLVRYNIK